MDGTSFAVRIRITEFQRFVGRPFARLKQRQQLAEDLGRVSTVDLLDHHDKLRRRILRSGLDSFHEDTVRQRQLAFASGAPPSNKVLVRQVGVELHCADLAVVLLPHQREREPFG